jgi:hypothetical protein
MPVVAAKRHVLRGRIRQQVQYQLLLGNRLVDAYLKNLDLLIFTPGTGSGSQPEFSACLAQMAIALSTRA